MDVAPSGVTKASALEPLRERLGVARRTLAVGDGRNDVDMLTWAARGVAMGHAPDDVRSCADEVTGTVRRTGPRRARRAPRRPMTCASSGVGAGRKQ